jgi:CRP-like cAMP-binding protein
MTSDGVTADELGRHPLFSGMEGSALDGLADRAARQRLRDGAVLYERGHEAHDMFLVVHGTLVLRATDGEHMTIVQSVGPEDILGWSALRESPHWLTTASAAGSVELISIPLAAILDVIEAGGPNARRLAQRLFGVGAAHLEATRIQLQRPASEAIITGG